MKINKGSYFKINDPMIIGLGIVEDTFLLQRKVYSKGSILLPYNTHYYAVSDVFLSEIPKTKNHWYDEALILKLENYILRESNIQKKILMLLYFYYLKDYSLTITIPYNKQDLAKMLNITSKEFNLTIKNLSTLEIIKIYKNTYFLNIEEIKKILSD